MVLTNVQIKQLSESLDNAIKFFNIYINNPRSAGWNEAFIKSFRDFARHTQIFSLGYAENKKDPLVNNYYNIITNAFREYQRLIVKYKGRGMIPDPREYTKLKDSKFKLSLGEDEHTYIIRSYRIESTKKLKEYLDNAKKLFKGILDIFSQK